MSHAAATVSVPPIQSDDDLDDQSGDDRTFASSVQPQAAKSTSMGDGSARSSRTCSPLPSTITSGTASTELLKMEKERLEVEKHRLAIEEKKLHALEQLVEIERNKLRLHQQNLQDHNVVATFQSGNDVPGGSTTTLRNLFDSFSDI